MAIFSTITETQRKLSPFLLNPDDIKKYRSALMGIAILWVIAFHSKLDLPILKDGNMGVDIFMFLSAIGLCFSFDKDSNLKSFYKKRILRIIPTWWLAMGAIGIIAYHFDCFEHPFASNFTELILTFSGIGYWMQTILYHLHLKNITINAVYFEWYIPALLFFYILFPFLAKRKATMLVLLLSLWEIVVWLCTTHGVAESLSLAIPRFSVFVYGILYYKIHLSSTSSRAGSWLVAILLITAFLLFVSGHTVKHHYILLLLPSALKLLCVAIEKIHIVKPLAFFGSLSLELYLVHIHWNLPDFSVGSVIISCYISLFLKIAICIVLALILRVGARGIQTFVTNANLTKKATPSAQ